MSQDIREASEIIDQILRQLADNKVPLTEIHPSLREAIADLMLARQAREKVVGADDFNLNSNPISEVLQEPSISSPSIKRKWSEYKAWFEGVDTRLPIEAFRSVVSSRTWCGCPAIKRGCLCTGLRPSMWLPPLRHSMKVPVHIQSLTILRQRSKALPLMKQFMKAILPFLLGSI